MAKQTTHGQKGGSGATAGRKAETIEAKFIHGGEVYRKRVFFGQRWMTLLQSEEHGSLVQAWPSEADARAYLDPIDGDRWPVQLVAEATVVTT